MVHVNEYMEDLLHSVEVSAVFNAAEALLDMSAWSTPPEGYYHSLQNGRPFQSSEQIVAQAIIGVIQTAALAVAEADALLSRPTYD
ncbi:hypothetical protein PENSUB_1914 [Penicillium subrubescens]|uniref:Uncharacterized protein n=1 Tax=Penicillium subrubescens TaxID=1316194 RepID=A0A1Q5UIX5_9EURO|nr:hypothetical protein PENSUB_1914 [Penicillium subrubescens]